MFYCSLYILPLYLCSSQSMTGVNPLCKTDMGKAHFNQQAKMTEWVAEVWCYLRENVALATIIIPSRGRLWRRHPQSAWIIQLISKPIGIDHINELIIDTWRRTVNPQPLPVPHIIFNTFPVFSSQVAAPVACSESSSRKRYVSENRY